ncbi:MAG: TOBE domain-containing protein, partial [Phycisphaerales bacterium]|nr:TOBE domain-containing protein [Phycisphaerales bacterium]
CSIRPESWTITEPGAPDSLAGTIEHTTYLGEVLQHVIHLEEGSVKVLELGLAASRREIGQHVGLRVDPDQVSLIPSE